MSTKYIKNKDKSVQIVRFVVQIAFSLLCIWIGIEFSQFIAYLESNGVRPFHHRPPGVEGFLPISALMSVVYFFQTGIVHPVHPAGFFIFLAIVGVSLVFGKAFCSWLCPVGFLSELVGDFGDKVWKKIFKRRFKLPRLLDYPLRSLKYLLLAFFAFAIFSMTETALAYFLSDTYNIVSDVKMYYFFANISRFSLIVIGILFFLSIVVRNFWCRYLCPYGALLGIAGLLSPNKIRRDAVNCIDCGLCTKACPSFIKVDKVITVRSDECTSCLNCVDVCPVEDTLYVRSFIGKKKISKKLIAAGVIMIFVAITGFGMISGNWHNKVPPQEYLRIHKDLDAIGHPTSTSDIKELNRSVEKGRIDGEK
ncbi:MAG: ferredoxin [Ignavibacteriae bacterium HGW-Ignavibacteriae-3]|nr:MAG: ferredoxin [Ignavibacteriae bacterium HGW-Ignavibacteriae-3]